KNQQANEKDRGHEEQRHDPPHGSQCLPYVFIEVEKSRRGLSNNRSPLKTVKRSRLIDSDFVQRFCSLRSRRLSADEVVAYLALLHPHHRYCSGSSQLDSERRGDKLGRTLDIEMIQACRLSWTSTKRAQQNIELAPDARPVVAIAGDRPREQRPHRQRVNRLGQLLCVDVAGCDFAVSHCPIEKFLESVDGLAGVLDCDGPELRIGKVGQIERQQVSDYFRTTEYCRTVHCGCEQRFQC